MTPNRTYYGAPPAMTPEQRLEGLIKDLQISVESIDREMLRLRTEHQELLELRTTLEIDILATRQALSKLQAA